VNGKHLNRECIDRTAGDTYDGIRAMGLNEGDWQERLIRPGVRVVAGGRTRPA
jgi:hypothetical protein